MATYSLGPNKKSTNKRNIIMTTPKIEKLKLHNKNVMNESLLVRDYESYNNARGWYNCLNYITNNYKLEEK